MDKNRIIDSLVKQLEKSNEEKSNANAVAIKVEELNLTMGHMALVCLGEREDRITELENIVDKVTQENEEEKANIKNLQSFLEDKIKAFDELKETALKRVNEITKIRDSDFKAKYDRFKKKLAELDSLNVRNEFMEDIEKHSLEQTKPERTKVSFYV